MGPRNAEGHRRPSHTTRAAAHAITARSTPYLPNCAGRLHPIPMDIHLLPKSRTAARHFLVRKMVHSAVTKPFPADVVACGEELPEMRLSDLARRTTKDHDAVTCEACWAVAHPAPSQFPQ